MLLAGNTSHGKSPEYRTYKLIIRMFTVRSRTTTFDGLITNIWVIGDIDALCHQLG
jgi:hypothetical protein